MVLSETEIIVAEALSVGLPICTRPYHKIAEAHNLSEQDVIDAITSLNAKNVISRFGLIVRHRKLGYTNNAMVVWDIPDDKIDSVGRIFADHQSVTLCYQRPRRLPDWSYNLFCMIHGKERSVVLSEVKTLIELSGIVDVSYDVLFSTHAYKQRGARYVRTNR